MPWNALEAFVRRLRNERRIPNLAVAVFGGEERLWQVCLGSESNDDRHALGPDTPFLICSLTKPMTATMLMQLVEREVLNLDDPLRRWLPELPDLPGDPDPRPITLRQVAAHVAGLPDWHGEDVDADGPDLDELLAVLAQKGRLCPPLRRYAYSSLGYALLGEALSRAAGRSYEDWMKEELFQPLAMKHASFLPPSNERSGHRPDASGAPVAVPLPAMGAFAPSGGLWASLNDLGAYLSLQFKEGPSSRHQPLGGTALRTQRAPFWMEPDGSGGSAMGWRVGSLHGNTWIGHMGGWAGFSAEMMSCPERKLSMVCLADREAAVGGICYEGLSFLLQG